MNIPNLLTLSRLVLIVPFCYFVTGGLKWDTLAFIVFVVAACTDWFDGFYARRYQQFSDAGKLLDPLADKLLVTTALIAFVADPIIKLPVWTVVLILGREFLITGLRSILAQYQEIMAADNLGKAKTATQMCAIILFLFSRAPDSQSYLMLSYAVYYVAVVLTLLSGVEYLWRYRAQLEVSFRSKPQ